MSIDVLILNRNLKSVSDRLANSLERYPLVSQVHIIDAGSRDSEVSERTLVADRGELALAQGLRPSRGFNLGLDAWSHLENKASWVLLLPNDSELLNDDFDGLLMKIENIPEIVAAVPTSPESPYENLLDDNGVALGWNFHEGPLLLRSTFALNQLKNKGHFFDPQNFRGYCSFLELALQTYSQNYAIVSTNLVSFSENESHLLSNYELIGTEPLSENQRLLISEGERWLTSKYGYQDRRNLELVCRLVFEEFLSVHPTIVIPPAI